MDRSQTRPERYQTVLRQIIGHKRIKATQEQKRAEIISESHPIPVQIHRKSIRTNRRPETITKEG